MNPEKTPEIISEEAKEEARKEIMAIRGEVALLGANDGEFSVIDDIIKELEAGLKPEEAVRRAAQVRDSKADYH